MYCPDCGEEIDDSCEFCPECGCDIDEVTSPDTRKEDTSTTSNGFLNDLREKAEEEFGEERVNKAEEITKKVAEEAKDKGEGALESAKEKADEKEKESDTIKKVKETTQHKKKQYEDSLDELEEKTDSTKEKGAETAEKTKQKGAEVAQQLKKVAIYGTVTVFALVIIAAVVGTVVLDTGDFESTSTPSPSTESSPDTVSPTSGNGNSRIGSVNVETQTEFGRNPIGFDVQAYYQGTGTLEVYAFGDGASATSLQETSDSGSARFSGEIIPPEEVNDGQAVEVSFVLSVEGQAVDTRTVQVEYSE